MIVEVIAQGCGGVSDTTPPVISNPQPPDASLLNTAKPAISAQYTDDPNGAGIDVNSARLSVDGTDVTPASSVSLTGISYTPASNLPEGTHTVTVAVADKSINAAGLTWRFTTDTVAPAPPVMTQPAPPTNIRTTTLMGTAEALSIVTIYAGPGSSNPIGTVPADAQGSFSLGNVTLLEGDNAFTAAATDAAGNTGNPSAPVSVTLDSIAPAPPVMTPPASPTNIRTITLMGTAEALSFVTIYAGPGSSSPVGTVPADAQGSFSLGNVALIEGVNTFTATAMDGAGNTGNPSTPVSVTLDTVAPVVTITAPQADAWFRTPAITVTGTINEPVTTVTVNGTPATITGTGFSLTNFQLTEDVNAITVIATDLAGNPGPGTVTATLDTVAPVIQIMSPVQGSFINTPTITVSGSVTELHLAEVRINGTQVPFASGSFSLSGFLLSEGSNTITVRATDNAWNASELPVPLTLDTIAPVVTITAPVPNALLGSQQVTVSGTVSELNTTVTVNGSPAQVIGQDFTLSGVALAEGPNDIHVVATDRAGNPGPAGVNVKVDTIKPAPPVLGQPLSPTKMLQTSITGTAEPGSTVEVSATGPDGLSPVIGTLSADTQGGFTIPVVTLVAGTTSFTATATDATGNKSDPSAAVLVTLDTVPPVITVTGPVNNSFIGTPTVQVTGSLDDAAAILTINGTEVPLNGTNFDHTATLTSGLNSIVLVATDAADNPSSTTILVTLDQTKPVVTITSPLSNITVTNPQVLVSGFVDEPVTVGDRE